MAMSAENEKFFRHFQQQVAGLQEQLSRIESHGISGGERADAIDHCMSAISRLSNEVQEASSYIPPHDKRTYGEAIKALQTKLQEVRAAGLPRQKFSFKKSASMITAQKNESAISIGDAAEIAAQKTNRLPGTDLDRSKVESIVQSSTEHDDASKDNTTTKHLQHLENNQTSPGESQKTTTISNHNNEHICLPTNENDATSSAIVFDVERCIVDLSSTTTHGQQLATLTLKNISSSLIICGNINGAVHLTNVQNSVLVMASRQFRMHESSNCDVYLHTTSRPIIEDCAAIRFAPLPPAYTTATIQDLTNQWFNVDDFKWLRNEQSPNWSQLDPLRWVADSVWQNVVSGGHGLSVDEMLSAVGVRK